MGPLIFVARKHQIQRKKSQLNMRLMRIQNQREQIAEQIGNAQQAKTARQNLFNSTNRMCTNALTNALNLQNMYNNYANNQALYNAFNNSSLFNSNDLGNKLINNNGTLSFNAGAFTALPQTESVADGFYNNNGTIVSVKDGVQKEATPEQYLTSAYASGQSNMSNYLKSQMYTNMMNNMSSMSNMLALQNLNNNSSFLSNLFNVLSNSSDEAELESLNAIDSQLEQEQTTVETQIKMLEAELSSVDKQLDNEIKQAAPKFGLSG